MKKCLLLLVGLLPFLLGWLIDWAMWAYPDVNVARYLIWLSLLFLLVWGALSWLLVRVGGGVKQTVLRAYWPNAVGIWTQMFYLPLLQLGFRLTAWSTSVFSAYCAGFLLMLLTSFGGCHMGMRTLASQKHQKF